MRLLDSPGAERNAIVLAGKVKNLRRPRLLLVPEAGAKQTGKELSRHALPPATVDLPRPRKRPVTAA